MAPLAFAFLPTVPESTDATMRPSFTKSRSYPESQLKVEKGTATENYAITERLPLQSQGAWEDSDFQSGATMRRCVSLPPQSSCMKEIALVVPSNRSTIAAAAVQQEHELASKESVSTAATCSMMSLEQEHEDGATLAISADTYWIMPSRSPEYTNEEDDYDFYVETEAEEYCARMEDLRYQQERMEEVQEPQLKQPRQSVQHLIDTQDWTQLVALVERNPNACRQRVRQVFQGENTSCLPLHAVVGRQGAALCVIDCLVTAYPAALLRKDEGDYHLPLHMAILKGASVAVIRYLGQALSQSLEMPDRQGNLPLHYAAMYSSEEVIRLLMDLYPHGCQHPSAKKRLPLHLLCARIWDKDLLSLSLIRHVMIRHLAAVEHADHNGRLPLHLACSQPQPRWDVLKLLVKAYPDALVHKDDAKRTPFQMARHLSVAGFRDNDVVLAYLREKTNEVKRSKSLFNKLFTIKVVSAKNQYCYG